MLKPNPRTVESRLAWQRARTGLACEGDELMVGKKILNRISMWVVAIVGLMYVSNFVTRAEAMGGTFAEGRPSLEREVSPQDPKP